MPEKPSFASQYRKEQAELVRQTCLYVATKLGDLLDELVVVVPEVMQSSTNRMELFRIFQDSSNVGFDWLMLAWRP